MSLTSRSLLTLSLIFWLGSAGFPRSAHALDSSCELAGPERALDGSASDTVREIAGFLYQPFAQYDFGRGGICIDPKPLQVLANVYLRRSDGYAPNIDSLCVNRSEAGVLTIRWSLGPTPEGALLVESGAEDEDYVETHDFWRVHAPQSLICSDRMNLNELIFERDGGIDVRVNSYTADGGTGASIRLHGLSVNATLPASGLPAFLTDGVGIQDLVVSDQGLFTADLSAPIFNIPVSATPGPAPADPMSIDVLGIHFWIRSH